MMNITTETGLCDAPGCKETNVAVIKMEEGKDWKICPGHLSKMLKKELGESWNYRGLPLIEYEHVKNDRGETYDQTIKIGELEFILNCDSHKVLPDEKIAQIVKAIGSHEKISVVFYDTMEGKYDSMTETERFMLSTDVFIKWLHDNMSANGYSVDLEDLPHMDKEEKDHKKDREDNEDEDEEEEEEDDDEDN